MDARIYRGVDLSDVKHRYPAITALGKQEMIINITTGGSGRPANFSRKPPNYTPNTNKHMGPRAKAIRWCEFSLPTNLVYQKLATNANERV